eukprot:g29444.t1
MLCLFLFLLGFAFSGARSSFPLNSPRVMFRRAVRVCAQAQAQTAPFTRQTWVYHSHNPEPIAYKDVVWRTRATFVRQYFRANVAAFIAVYLAYTYLDIDTQRRAQYNVLMEIEDNKKFEILKANIAAWKEENPGQKPSEAQLLKWVKAKKGIEEEE